MSEGPFYANYMDWYRDAVGMERERAVETKDPSWETYGMREPGFAPASWKVPKRGLDEGVYDPNPGETYIGTFQLGAGWMAAVVKEDDRNYIKKLKGGPFRNERAAIAEAKKHLKGDIKRIQRQNGKWVYP